MITINSELLPDTSDNLSTKTEVHDKIKEFGHPTEIIWKYQTSAVLSLPGKIFIKVPLKAIEIK